MNWNDFNFVFYFKNTIKKGGKSELSKFPNNPSRSFVHVRHWKKFAVKTIKKDLLGFMTTELTVHLSKKK